MFDGWNSDDKCLIILLSLNIKYCCLKIYFGGRLTVTFGDSNQVGYEQVRKGLQTLFSLCCFLSCCLSQHLQIQFLPIVILLMPIINCTLTKAKNKIECVGYYFQYINLLFYYNLSFWKPCFNKNIIQLK